MGTNRVILRNARLATLAFGLLGGYFLSAYYYLERRPTEPGRHAASTSQRLAFFGFFSLTTVCREKILLDQSLSIHVLQGNCANRE